MNRHLFSLVGAGVVIIFAAAGCSSERILHGPDADHVKDMVAARYDRFAASGGEVCEQ